jgi:hypothetical protein
MKNVTFCWTSISSWTKINKPTSNFTWENVSIPYRMMPKDLGFPRMYHHL